MKFLPPTGNLALLLPILLLLFSVGCDKPASPPAQPQATITASEVPPALTEPLEVVLVESPSDALPTWRAHRKQRPTLLLFTSDPMLQRVPAQLTQEVAEHVEHADINEFRQRGTMSADTLLLPGQVLRSALEANFFAEVIWVLPVAADENEENYLEAGHVRQHLLQIGAINESEAETIRVEEGGFTASFAGTPFRATRPAYLAESPGADTVVHLDLTYFRDIYQGELKTPLYKILHDTLTAIKKTKRPVLAATVTLGNLLDLIPLQYRFLGSTISQVFKEPQLLTQEAPASWKLREDVLYLDNFFQPEKIRDLYLKMDQQTPGDPSVQYGLYQSAVAFKALAPAMKYLARAVALDSGYSKEYLDLALDSEKGNNPLRTVELLKMASRAMPDNPFIKLRMIEKLNEAGEPAAADKLTKELQSLTWSPVYASQVPAFLSEQLQNNAEEK